MEGDNYNVTIPVGLAPGAYLIRNEVGVTCIECIRALTSVLCS